MQLVGWHFITSGTLSNPSCSFSPLCAPITSSSGQKRQWHLLAPFGLERRRKHFQLGEKEKTFLVPGGVSEQRIPLSPRSGGAAAGYSQPCSGWRGSIKFSEKSYAALLIFSDVLQFMQIPTSELGEILKTDDLHAQKYQWNLKWTGSSCIFVLTPRKHYRNPERGKLWGWKVGLDWGRLLQPSVGCPAPLVTM